MPEVNALWVSAAAQICEVSQCLKQLTVQNTRTTAEEGAIFLLQLANAELSTLEELDLCRHGCDEDGNWFGGKQEPVDLLLQIVARQTGLCKLNLERCYLTDSQQAQVRQALAGR